MMAAKPKVKFMGRKGGVIHVITTKTWDLKNSTCPQVKKGHSGPGWRGKSLSPEAALDLQGCSKCETHGVAEAERKARMTPAQKRAETIRLRDETTRKIAQGSKKPKIKKEPKPKAEPKQRRGPRGGDATERMKANVEEHAKIATEAGWKAKAFESGTNEWTCEAKRNGETLKLIYRDGRTVHARVVLASGVEVRLRNSSNWRKHATGMSKIKSDYSPRPAGKKAAKAEVIKDDKPRKLPFTLDDDDSDVIESLLGKTITWRNSVSLGLETATLPLRSRNCRITTHPKSGRRMVSFYEHQGFQKDGDQTVDMLGGERTVYIDKILKAR